MKTFSAKAPEVKRQWWVIDAKNQYLGHVAVQAANLLRGKHKAIWTPHVDTGDFVVVINAAEIQIGGKKETQKSYMSFPDSSEVISPRPSASAASAALNFSSSVQSRE